MGGRPSRRRSGPSSSPTTSRAWAACDFSAWSERVNRTNLLLFRNDYRQPFGTFSGELPGGLRLAEG